MISMDSVEKQLKRINFNYKKWGKAEASELPNILHKNETIHECVNGIYDGGFALLVATNFRLLLIDKKPLNFLTVEDLRFDMINEIDYSHRLIGARITVSAGNKTLEFRSYNQQRLRKLIGHVQHGMADSKQEQSTHQSDQSLHLEKINQQLQAFLLAQHAQQEELRKQLETQLTTRDKKSETSPIELPKPAKPPAELSDYLLAQRLLDQVKKKPISEIKQEIKDARLEEKTPDKQPAPISQNSEMADLYAAGMQEIYGRQQPVKIQTRSKVHVWEIHPLKVAYSKLPIAMKYKKLGEPIFSIQSPKTASD